MQKNWNSLPLKDSLLGEKFNSFEFLPKIISFGLVEKYVSIQSFILASGNGFSG